MSYFKLEFLFTVFSGAANCREFWLRHIITILTGWTILTHLLVAWNDEGTAAATPLSPLSPIQTQDDDDYEEEALWLLYLTELKQFWKIHYYSTSF